MSEQKQCEQIVLACATTGKQCKSRGVEKDCELKQPDKKEDPSVEHLRNHFLKMQEMLNEMFPLPAPDTCTCKCVPSGMPEAVFLFPRKRCPIHGKFSQLQGDKRKWDDIEDVDAEIRSMRGDLPTQKAPWEFPSYAECYNATYENPELTMYNCIKYNYTNYLKST
jgi:hypothetical protein